MEYSLDEPKWFIRRWIFSNKRRIWAPPFLQSKDPEDTFEPGGEEFYDRGVEYEAVR